MYIVFIYIEMFKNILYVVKNNNFLGYFQKKPIFIFQNYYIEKLKNAYEYSMKVCTDILLSLFHYIKYIL